MTGIARKMVWMYDERNWWLSKNDNKRTTQRLGIEGDGGIRVVWREKIKIC